MEIFRAGREALTFISSRIGAKEYFVGAQNRDFQCGIVYSPDEALEDEHFQKRVTFQSPSTTPSFVETSSTRELPSRHQAPTAGRYTDGRHWSVNTTPNSLIRPKTNPSDSHRPITEKGDDMHCGVMLTTYNQGDWPRLMAEDYDHPPATPDHILVEQTMSLGELVEPLGFDSIWTTEHYGLAYSMQASPLQWLTYWAGRTSRVDLGTAVIVAPWWNPVRLAHEISPSRYTPQRSSPAHWARPGCIPMNAHVDGYSNREIP